MMVKKLVFATVFGLFIMQLMACSRPYRKPVIDPQVGFNGIETLLKQSKSIGLITIHGMCHHDLTWMEKNLSHFSEALNMEISEIPPKEIFSEGTIGVKAYRSDLTKEGEQLSVYGIIYSSITLQAKQKNLCQDVSRETSVCPDTILTYNRKRASINAAVKNNLMNDCLADAVLYLGPAGEKIRAGVRDALTAIFNDMKRNQSLAEGPVVFLSESLGSKVLGDALLCGPPDALENFLPDLARTSHVFFSANQIPLLNLGSSGKTCTANSALKVLKTTKAKLRAVPNGKMGMAGFLDVIEAARTLKQYRKSFPDQEAESFTIVSFTDPNDLLSYEVLPKDLGGREVINIIVSNDSTVLNLIENPVKAHTGYRQNSSVLRLLREGSQ